MFSSSFDIYKKICIIIIINIIYIAILLIDFIRCSIFGPFPPELNSLSSVVEAPTYLFWVGF